MYFLFDMINDMDTVQAFSINQAKIDLIFHIK